MRPRTSAPGIILAATLVATLAACGSESNGDGASAGTEPTQVAATTPEPSESRSTDTPSTSAPEELSDEPDEGAPRAPAPPLEQPTELLVDGIEPLGDGGVPGGPDEEPGRYHSYRLGTEVVFDLPEPFGLGQHGAGTIVGVLGDDRVFFLSRWGENELSTPDEWAAELLDSGWDVAETDVDPISGYTVRRFDITPTSPRESIGGVVASGALSFRDGLPRRVWIVDQDDPQPLVIGTAISDDEWGDVVDGVVASLEVGPTLADPRNGREPIEYGGFFTDVTAGGQYRTLLFGDTIMRLPVDATVLSAAQFLSVDVPGDFTGTTEPAVDIGAVGQLILPPDDPSAGIFASTLGDPPVDAAAFVAFLESLAEDGLITNLREIGDTVTLLGETVPGVEFDVPDGNEVGAFVSAPDGWASSNFLTLFPATTNRAWVMDLDDQVAVVMVRADSANTEDLEAGTEFAGTVANALEAT